MHTTVIELPSEGKFYPKGHPLSDGELELKYMTAREEDILTDQNLLRKGIALDRLIERVIVNEDVDLDDMLLGDKSAVILATRIGAYGPEYPFEVDCPSCGESQQQVADLQEIESKDLPDDIETGSNEFEFDLPVSDKTVKIQLLTHSDSQKIQQELKNTKRGVDKKTLRGPVVSSQVTTRLKHLIVEIDGDRDQTKINNFVDNMLARDSHELRKFVRKINPDLDLTTDFMCDYCGHEEVLDIPLDANFLFPSE